MIKFVITEGSESKVSLNSPSESSLILCFLLRSYDTCHEGAKLDERSNDLGGPIAIPRVRSSHRNDSMHDQPRPNGGFLAQFLCSLVADIPSSGNFSPNILIPS